MILILINLHLLHLLIDLKNNNETQSKIFIGQWWKHPGNLFKGKHYPTIKDPTQKSLSFKILTQAYLGRIRQFAFFKDCHKSHIDQLKNRGCY